MIPRPVIAMYGLLLAAWMATATVSAAAEPPPSQFEKADLVKAAIIEKIARFIEWPRQAEGQFVLCVSADHPLLPVMRAYYASVVIADKPVVLQVIKRAEVVPACHLLFLGARELKDVARQRVAADRDHILLVAEGRDAARDGVHVAFYPDKDRLRLDVNRKALDASSLKASFRLLEVANIVD